jgi:hypothetical protein
MSHQPDFDLDFRRGRVGENLVNSFLQSLEGGTVEVKTDSRIAETGNLYIETYQFSKPDMSDKRPSGINISKADFWAFATPHETGFVIIKAKALKQLLRDGNYPVKSQPIVSQKTNGSIGRIVPLKDLLKTLGMF